VIDPFLITGLPRSRTAWLAAAAMNDHSICYHEPLQYFDRWDDVFTRIWGVRPDNGVRYIGVSDHALGFHLAAIMRRAAPRTLIVERPIADVKVSLARCGLQGTNFCALLQEALAFKHPNILRVSFAALESSDVVARCLAHLMPSAVISRARIEALQPLNIQANVALSLQAAAARAGDVGALLGADVVARLFA